MLHFIFIQKMFSDILGGSLHSFCLGVIYLFIFIAKAHTASVKMPHYSSLSTLKDSKSGPFDFSQTPDVRKLV